MKLYTLTLPEGVNLPDGAIQLWHMLSIGDELHYKGDRLEVYNGGGMMPVLAPVKLTPAQMEGCADGIQKAIECLKEVRESHRDPMSSDYNQCEKPTEECAWCDMA